MSNIKSNYIFLVIKAARIHQWVKNILVFIPLFLIHQLTNIELLSNSILAFLAFCVCASSVYFINDIHDIEADRKHPVKSKRPIASGALPINHGWVWAVLLMSTGLLLAFSVNKTFFYFVLFYVIATNLYSYVFKSIALADVVILAALYTVRIIGGAVAVHSEVTFWLLAFSLFFFFSLAMVKRYSELASLTERGESEVRGRGYHAMDTHLILILGVATGYLSVLIFALYLNESNILMQYSNPQWLWLITPVLLYWISRIWLLANRREISEDPVVFAVKDGVSYLAGLICMISIILAR